jgi:hypothetical protein
LHETPAFWTKCVSSGGRVGDLAQYEDGAFDLVICCDAPISYTNPDHVRTIEGLARVAGLAGASIIASRRAAAGHSPP